MCLNYNCSFFSCYCACGRACREDKFPSLDIFRGCEVWGGELGTRGAFVFRRVCSYCAGVTSNYIPGCRAPLALLLLLGHRRVCAFIFEMRILALDLLLTSVYTQACCVSLSAYLSLESHVHARNPPLSDCFPLRINMSRRRVTAITSFSLRRQSIHGFHFVYSLFTGCRGPYRTFPSYVAVMPPPVVAAR